MTRKRSVFVIGSGIAGLSAAYELQKAGWQVTVYERRDWPGGRMANRKRGHMLLETGATEIFSFYRDMLELIEELGLSEELVEVNAYLNFHIKSKACEYDFNYGANLLALLANPALSIRSKLRLPALLPDLVRFRRQVDPCFIETAAKYDDEDLDSYLSRKVGKDLVNGFVAPIFRLFWRWQPDSFSRAYFLAFFAHTMGCTAYTFKNGVGLLTRRLAERVPVRLGCEVQEIRSVDGAGVEISYRDSHGQRTETADILVSAVEAFQVPKLISDLPGDDREFFRGVRYTQGGTIHYLLKTSVPPRSIVFAAESDSPLLSYVQVPGSFPGFPDVPDRLWISLTPEYMEKHINPDGSNLDAITRPHVKALYPTLDDDLLEVQTQYEGSYLVLVYPGYIRKLCEFLKTDRSRRNGIYFCGDYLAHPHTGGACASGRRTARRILNEYRK